MVNLHLAATREKLNWYRSHGIHSFWSSCCVIGTKIRRISKIKYAVITVLWLLPLWEHRLSRLPAAEHTAIEYMVKYTTKHLVSIPEMENLGSTLKFISLT